MKKVAAAGLTVPGLDVSSYQLVINWQKVKESGIKFAFAKCYEAHEDQYFKDNRERAKAQGILFGAYDFFHPSRDPVEQAKEFLDMADPVKGDLPPMLDWESTDDVPTERDQENALKWLEYVSSQVGKDPILYTYPYFAGIQNLVADFKKYPLFISHPVTLSPLVPLPWNVWSFHQYSFTGSLDGFLNGVHEDLDRWNGSLEQLQKMVL